MDLQYISKSWKFKNDDKTAAILNVTVRLEKKKYMVHS